MSLRITKFFTRPLSLVSAAFLIHVGAATAADSPGDIQQQTKELLAGITTPYSTPQSQPRDDKATRAPVDAQSDVKELLLGTTSFRSGVSETSPAASGEFKPQENALVHDDIQATVRQFLQGRHAGDAS